jgi:hypothetical protein
VPLVNIVATSGRILLEIRRNGSLNVLNIAIVAICRHAGVLLRDLPDREGYASK